MSPSLRTALVVAVSFAIGAFGLVAEWVAYGPGGHASGVDATYPWMLDLLTGLVMAACGAIGVGRRPASLVGPLFLLGAVAWFAGTLLEPPRGVSTVFPPSAAFLYRGFLAHALVTFPSGRPADRVEWIAVGLGYVTALLAPLWHRPIWGFALVGLLVAVTWRAHRRARGWPKAARRDALGVAVLFAATVVVLTAGKAIGLPYPLSDAMTIGFHLVVMAGVVRLTARLARSDQHELTDLVVELGERPSTTLGGELGELLGDPTIRVALWSESRQAYVDELGPQLVPQIAAPRAGETRIDQDGRPLALVTHQPGTLDDPGIRRAVSDAIRLAAANARLRSRVRAQVEQLAASRRRLIVAGDDEGERLARRVHEGAIRHLEAVGARLRAAAAAAAISGPDSTVSGEGEKQAAVTRAAVERSQRRLERALDDLHGFALGLGPRRAVAGFRDGLAGLAQESPIPVDLQVEADRLPDALATDAYLVCAEALANIAKHARASRVRVEVITADRELRLRVSDDGVGGATIHGGAGLRGLADRVASLDGSLVIDSHPDRGTIVTARWPLDQRMAEAPVPAGVSGNRRDASAISPVSHDALPMGRS
ncbi:hypothetical protein BH24CHL9_BH24CHL9_12890 [soil metagenome]